jgi:hypothetical protein
MCVRGVLNKLLSIGVNHPLSLTLTNELRAEDNKTRDAVDSLIIGAFYHGYSRTTLTSGFSNRGMVDRAYF